VTAVTDLAQRRKKPVSYSSFLRLAGGGARACERKLDSKRKLP